MYASMKVPSSIDTMLDQVEQKQHLTLPLSNLAYSDPCLRIRKQIIFGSYIGVNDVNGVECDHLAFSSRNIDLQLWLDRSGKPVPRKIVINYRTEPGSPEYIAVLSDWKFPKEISDSHFSPQLPKDAKRIEFLKVKDHSHEEHDRFARCQQICAMGRLSRLRVRSRQRSRCTGKVGRRRRGGGYGGGGRGGYGGAEAEASAAVGVGTMVARTGSITAAWVSPAVGCRFHMDTRQAFRKPI